MKSSQFFYDMNAPQTDNHGKRKRENDHARRPPPKPTGKIKS